MPVPQRKILGICGSTKSASSNLVILKRIASQIAENADMQIYNRIADLPHFNPERTTDIEAVEEFRGLMQTVMD